MLDSSIESIPVTRRLVAVVDPDAFTVLKELVRKKGYTMQAAMILALINFVEADLTLEDVSPKYNK